jgi:O-acetyl-ADP-ribose deacetylase (regulator of RNase III)
VIRVLQADPGDLDVEVLLRSVGADLEACTPLEQRLGSRAGAEVLERLRGFGEVPVGGALVTPGGGLRASFLVHVVIRSAEEAISEPGLRRAFLNGLRQVAEWELETLAVPPLGIGAGNLDPEASARVMFSVLDEHLRTAAFPRDVLIPVSNAYEEDAFVREMNVVFPPEKGAEEEG